MHHISRTRQKHSSSHQAGFTLVELSIVLVIIGLIVGSVLVGQDMIKASEIRATISQLEKYSAAANTFRSKYNGLPGDLVSARATQFGINVTGMTGANGLGDGDGLLESAAGANASVAGEAQAFWVHLTLVNLADSSYVAGSFVPGVNIPQSKHGRGGITTYFLGNSNYFHFGDPTAVAAIGDSLTPLEAFNIDSKLDNGAPNTGLVRATSGFPTNANTAATPASGCATTTTAVGNYSTLTDATANAVACQLYYRGL